MLLTLARWLLYAIWELCHGFLSQPPLQKGHEDCRPGSYLPRFPNWVKSLTLGHLSAKSLLDEKELLPPCRKMLFPQI